MSDHQSKANEYAETYLLPSVSDAGSKAEHDVAFAAALLGSGLLSDRQLSTLLAGWSIHGTMPLSQQAIESGLLTEAQVGELNQNAVRTMQETLAEGGDETDDRRPKSSNLVAVLDRFDSTGRLARLLGVSSTAAAGSSEERASAARYQLIRRLGQGGLGTVWLARDLQLQRLVALKEVANAAEASDATVGRFRKEAEITGRLEHPGIVPIYQLCEDESTGRAFYTMRFLGKSTLHDSIAEYHERREEGDEDPMLLRHLLAAFVNVCNAVGHAHSRKVIHRDLKPENVVIDSYGQVILIDWGLAKVLDDAAVEQLEEGLISGVGGTVEGQVLGTPLYMAPEQAAGRIDEVDQRTDIYGLGAILFAIITGYAPHEKTQSQSVDSRTGVRGMLHSIASGPTPTAAEMHAFVDPALAAICAKAMARKRYARYQTASELSEEVQRWMAGEPVSAHRESPLQQTRRWIGRHQRLSQILAAVLAILLATGATLIFSARHEQLAAQQSRFERLSAEVHEIELQLRSAAANLIHNTRFMATLPPVEGIIRARAGSADDSEETWKERLKTIYTGLLRANPDYLAVSYIAASTSESEDAAAPGSAEILRVERNVNDRSFVRTVPESRLATVDNNAVLADVIRLEPGDVRLTYADPRGRETAANDLKRISGCVPIYGEATGVPFGMVAIETDLVGQLEAVVQTLGTVDGEIYIADGEGTVLISTGPDAAAGATAIKSIPAEIPELAPLFEADAEALTRTDGATYFARRFRVDATSKGVAIVARLGE